MHGSGVDSFQNIYRLHACDSLHRGGCFFHGGQLETVKRHTPCMIVSPHPDHACMLEKINLMFFTARGRRTRCQIGEHKAVNCTWRNPKWTSTEWTRQAKNLREWRKNGQDSKCFHHACLRRSSNFFHAPLHVTRRSRTQVIALVSPNTPTYPTYIWEPSVKAGHKFMN